MKLLVIGGGIAGLCTAHYAQKAGLEVTVLEPEGPGRNSTSFGNAGMVVPSHFVPLAAPGMIEMGLRWMWNPESPFYVKPRLSLDLLRWGYWFWRASSAARVQQVSPLLRDLNLASRNAYAQLATELPQAFGFEQRGLLMLCHSAHGLAEESHAAQKARELGLEAHVLSANEVQKLEPGIQMQVAGGVYYPGDAHLNPKAFMQSLEHSLRQRGVRFVNSTLVGWQQQSDRLVAAKLAEGELQADQFVLCAGAWSQNLAAMLGLRLPLQAGKGYSFVLEQPTQKPSIPAILTEARVAVTPLAQGLRFGGTMEIAGLKPGINPRRINGIRKAIPRYYPAFQSDALQGRELWYGLRPCSPDGLPYIGRTARFANLSIASGHAMMGLSLGPITGQLISQVLLGQTPSLPLGPLSPDRYA